MPQWPRTFGAYPVVIELQTPPQGHPDASRQVELLSDPASFHMADDWYDYATPDHFWFQWRLDVLLRLLEGTDPGLKILEVGCGSGAARAQLETHYDRPIDGCDLNLRALEVGRPGRGQLYFYNIHDRRPQWSGYFDTVFLLDTLEHIEAPEPFLESVAWHLKPGGLLIVNVPALSCLYSRYDALAGHMRRYRVGTLASELEPSGFRLLGHAYWGLTMIPVAALRKLMVRFMPEDRVIERGFQPSSVLVDKTLRALMHVEQRLLAPPWIGTSLAAVAERLPAATSFAGEDRS